MDMVFRVVNLFKPIGNIMPKPKVKAKPIHTVPNSNGGWDNKQNGKTISHSKTKKVAEEKGRKSAIKDATEHCIHNKDGKISESNSYGGDPCPPKG